MKDSHPLLFGFFMIEWGMSENNVREDDYIYIRRWGRMMGSREYYIKDQQRKALEECANIRAIYKNKDSDGWVTVDEIKDELTRQKIMNG